MKKYFQILFAALALVTLTNALNAQTRVAASSNEQNDFVVAAKETSRQIGLLLPAVQKVREAAARSFANILTQANTLAQKVERAGSKMSSSQYQAFQRELASIEAQLDKLDANTGNGTSAGNPAPGTSGECHKSCHDAFGDGFGGGKGWNRFWCKVGCIKIKVGPVSTGG